MLIKIHGAPNFDVEVTKLSNSWQVVLQNIEYTSNVSGGTLTYKLEDSSNWIIAGETIHFEVTKPRNVRCTINRPSR